MADAELPASIPPPSPGPPLPFEFVVNGRPVSHQSHNRAILDRWRERVRAAAAARWVGRTPLAVPVRVVVVYYHEGAAARIDGDNMLKPIQDSLIGLVYDDDSRITDAATRKTPIDAPIRARHESLILLQAFAAGDEFVHVMIDHAPSHEVPLR